MKRILLTMVSIALLTACSSKFDEKVTEYDATNNADESSVEHEFETTNTTKMEVEDDISSTEAIENNDLDTVELSKKDAILQESYTNPEDAAAYYSELLYDFHSGGITPAEYEERSYPYMSTEYKSILPSDSKSRLEAYKTIQDFYLEQGYEITNYLHTEVTVGSLGKEAHFYRMYEISEDKPSIYFITTLIKEGEYWFIMDDGPAPPFNLPSNS